MGSAGQRLIALLIGIALALLVRPGELLAKQGPHTVGCDEAQDVAMQPPRRQTMAPAQGQLGADDEQPKLAHSIVGDLGFACALAGALERRFCVGDAASGRERHRRVQRLRTRGPPLR